MALGKHERTQKGRFREERGDVRVKNLKATYSEFEGVNGNTKLQTLKDHFQVSSLNDVRKALRKGGWDPKAGK